MLMKENIQIFSLEHIRHYPYTKRRSTVTTSPHAHEFFEISYILNGTVYNNVSGKIMKLGYGDFGILRPNDAHFYFDYSEPNFDYRDVYIPCEIMKRACDFIDPALYDNILNTPEPLYFTLGSAHINSIEESASKFDNIYKKTEEYDNLLLGFAVRILYIYKETQLQLSDKHVYPQWLSTILREIDEHPLEANFERILDSIQYTRGHVCRLFKKYLGCTLYDYITDAKLSHSTILLLNREMTVLEIASLIGYSNQSNYINAFKRKFGMPPTQWRKTHGGAPR